MTKGRIVSRTEYIVPVEATPKQGAIATPLPPETEQNLTPAETSCGTMVRAESIVAQQHIVTIHKIEDNSHSCRVGRHSRKTKGKTYSSPRILLGPRLDQFIGCHCRVFKARASVTGSFWNLQDKDVLIVVLLP